MSSGKAMITHPLRRDYKRRKEVNMRLVGKLEGKHREIEGLVCRTVT